MAVLEYPYLAYKSVHLPLIPITIGSNLVVYALVDSGATVSLFEAKVAEALNINLARGKKRLLTGIGGRILAYEHRIMIRIGPDRFPCRICFSPELKVSFNLLGQEDFFDHFTVTLIKRQKTLRLESLSNPSRPAASAAR